MNVSKSINSINEKFKKDELNFEFLTNKNLICKDCKNRFDDEDTPGNVSKCAKFEIKPDDVLDGGKCSFYEKE